MEEIIIDSLVESAIQNTVEMYGYSSDVGFWLSSLATSARESLIGGGASTKIDIDTQIEQIMSEDQYLQEKIAALEVAMRESGDFVSVQKFWKQ